MSKSERLKRLARIAERYKASGHTEKLVERFRKAGCDKILCSECPTDELVGEYIICDHLIHGASATIRYAGGNEV